MHSLEDYQSIAGHNESAAVLARAHLDRQADRIDGIDRMQVLHLSRDLLREEDVLKG